MVHITRPNYNNFSRLSGVKMKQVFKYLWFVYLKQLYANRQINCLFKAQVWSTQHPEMDVWHIKHHKSYYLNLVSLCKLVFVSWSLPFFPGVWILYFCTLCARPVQRSPERHREWSWKLLLPQLKNQIYIFIMTQSFNFIILLSSYMYYYLRQDSS